MKTVNINSPDIDIYQTRYLSHQLHKKSQLLVSKGIKKPITNMHSTNFYSKLLKDRRSQRISNSSPISEENFDFILSCLSESPSSCNRQAISLAIIKDRTRKELLGGILVGGVGWCHRADIILLLYSQNQAYKENLDYMKYLDTGILVFNAYLASEILRIGCCFINPNIRDENKNIFETKFPYPGTFCGAIALGNYDKKVDYSPKILPKDLIL